MDESDTPGENKPVPVYKVVLLNIAFNAAVLLSFFLLWFGLAWAVRFMLASSHTAGVTVLVLVVVFAVSLVVCYHIFNRKMGDRYDIARILDALRMEKGRKRRIIVVVGSALRFIALLYLGMAISVSCVFYVLQERFLYQPANQIEMTPADLGIYYEDVYFNTSDGVRLNGWYVPYPGSNRTVLFCHGNAGNMGSRTELVGMLGRMELNVFVFDYRGFGSSGGEPSEEGTYRDAEAALDYLVSEKNCSYGNVIIYGFSMGGAVGIHLAAEHEPALLILEGTFTSYEDVARVLLRRTLLPIPVTLLTRFDYPAGETVRKIKCPVLVIHSRDDELVPFTQGEEVYRNANEPKEFLEITGSHNEGYVGSVEYMSGVEGFIDRHG